jgi:hypothetical protein
MHDSVIRLLACAKRATAHKPAGQRVTDFQSLQLLMGITPAVLSNWKKRGVSRDGLLLAETRFGCQATWVRDGRGDDWKYPQTPVEGVSMAVAQELSYPSRTAAAPRSSS